MSRLKPWQGVVLAFVLTLLLAARWEPMLDTGTQQGDFWLVWLFCMMVLTLPMLLLESALAKRTQLMPLQALPALTRDADTSPRWRVVGWMGVLATLLVGGSLAVEAGILLAQIGQGASSLSSMVWLVVALVAVWALSFVAPVLWVSGIALVVLIGIDLVAGAMPGWQWTAFSLAEWSAAVELALLCTGSGLGLYWILSVRESKQDARVLIWPILIAQVLAGLLYAWGGIGAALLPNAHQVGVITNSPVAGSAHVAVSGSVQISTVLYLVAVLTGAAALIRLLRVQLRGRSLPFAVTEGILLAGLALWLLPVQSYLSLLALLLALVTAAVYAVFSGWQMKTSHLRKALNFDNEALYNLWRVAVRLVVPLAVLVALVGLIW